MADQTELNIPPPEETDNIFLKVIFSDMAEEAKKNTLAKLLDPQNHFESASHDEILQQSSYADGYLSGATKRTAEEEAAFIKGCNNVFIKILTSDMPEEQQKGLIVRALTDQQDCLRQYQFMMGYWRGKRRLNEVAEADFKKVPVARKNPASQSATKSLPSERPPRVTGFVDALKM